MCQSELTGQVNCQVGLASFLSNPDFDLKLNDINTDVLSLQLLGDRLCETSLENFDGHWGKCKVDTVHYIYVFLRDQTLM